MPSVPLRPTDRISARAAPFNWMDGADRTDRGLEPEMFLYQILLATGALGLLAMALLGFVHHGGHHGNGNGGGHGHAAHGGNHGGEAHGGHVHVGGANHAGHGPDLAHAPHHGAGHANGHAHGDGGAHGAAIHVLSLLSPMTLFSAALGAGAVGSLLTTWDVSPALTAAAAGLGAISFNALLVRPMLRFVMGFASAPARGLVGTLMQPAEAITAFDANGEGLVRVLVDGQSVDVLARLTDEERTQGARIIRGQSVRVEEVDPRTNRCRVSRL
jgi:hypothetical protein